MNTYLGLDVGGTNIRLAVWDEAEPKVVARADTPQGFAKFVETIAGLVAPYTAVGVGVGFPGVAFDQHVGWVPKLPFLTDEDVAAELSAVCRAPVFFSNDAHAALLGEARFGAAKEAKVALLVSLGTGIGGGLLIGGRVFRGASGSAGSFGWVNMSLDDPTHPEHGQLELQASGSALDAAAVAAMDRYRALTRGDGFMEFFEQVTPIEELGQLNLGSRPTRRAGAPSMANLRAIPWVFAFTQCRANLPGWYGLGAALGAIDPGLAQEMYREWPFFTTMIDFAQMSLAKADMNIFGAYLGLVEERHRHFGVTIERHHAETVKLTEAVTGAPLLDNDPVLARALSLRNPYVDPISRVQVELLRRLRSQPPEGPEREAIAYGVMLSLMGVSAGMRNTG
jgi:hypothetical protein